MSTQTSVNGGLRRVLGPVDATCIVVGAIIGVGIFFTPSQVAAHATSAPLAMIAWGLGGVIAMLGALTFAELGGMYPRSGGQYEILRDAYGPAPAFLFVFCNATAIQAGATAVIAIICANHVAAAAGVELSQAWRLVSAGLLIGGLVLANGLGVRFGSGIQNLTVLAKLATLAVVVVLAVVHGGNDAPAAPVEPAVAAEPAGGLGVLPLLFAGLVPAFFAYGGWQHALWMAGEVRRPRRDVPLAIIGGVAIVVTAYVLVNWAYLALLGYGGVVESDALAADAVTVAWPGAGRVVAGAVAVSAFGVLNAQLLSGPRLVYGMARDGRFFKVFAVTSARFGTPIAAIVLIGAMALVLLASRANLDSLLAWVVVIDGGFFCLTGLALIVLRRKRSDAERPIRVPLYPLVPILFVLGELGIVTGAALHPELRVPALIGAAWVLGALGFYFIWFRGSRTGPSVAR